MSSSNFFFYDLETSGLNPSRQRIMQFAGQKTDMNLNPVGEPINVLVRLSEDILPEPEAILITKTTPQKTLEEGISEPELAQLITEKVCTPGTIMVGFNNIRFDDEFMRYTLWRNFYDPYEWCYKDSRSRWDMLDVVRMTRALRPEGITWPVDKEGQPSNRLEELSAINKLNHEHAHDALSDVRATIGIARLIKQKQPKLFDYLLGMRQKNKVKELVNLDAPVPFVYSSGRYGKLKSFTAVGMPIARGSRDGGIVIYDLSINPESFFKLNTKQLCEKIFASYKEKQDPGFTSIPVKELFYNKAPAVAPLSVMDEASWQRLELDKNAIKKHIQLLQRHKDFTEKVSEAFKQKPAFQMSEDIEGQLYDGFINEHDKPRMAEVRSSDETALANLTPKFDDKRLRELYIRYKARNYPKTLNENERKLWEDYRMKKFVDVSPSFMQSLQKQAALHAHNNEAQFIIEELRLWAETTAPLE